MKITIQDECCEEKKTWKLSDFGKKELFERYATGTWRLCVRTIGGPYGNDEGFTDFHNGYNWLDAEAHDTEEFRPFNKSICAENEVKRGT